MTTLSSVINEKCFNCHDKRFVLVANHETKGALKKIPCPICNKPTEASVANLEKSNG